MSKLYLIHFAKPYKHARHYLGFTAFASAEKRFQEHKRGKGANLTRVAVAAGIELQLVWVVDGDRREERRRKRASHVWKSCSICRRERGLKD